MYGEVDVQACKTLGHVGDAPNLVVHNLVCEMVAQNAQQPHLTAEGLAPPDYCALKLPTRSASCSVCPCLWISWSLYSGPGGGGFPFILSSSSVLNQSPFYQHLPTYLPWNGML